MSLTASFIIQEDGTRAKKSGELVYEGSPMTLEASTGLLKLAAAGDKVYGLSKGDSNAFVDQAFGEFGAFGSGQLTMLTRGICVVNQSIFNQVEVNTSTSTSSSPTTVKLYDDTKTYQPMDPLYVDATGLISNAPGASKASLFGKCLKYLPAGAAGGLEIEVDPGASHTTADMA